jgi:hypothetical protein
MSLFVTSVKTDGEQGDNGNNRVYAFGKFITFKGLER